MDIASFGVFVGRRIKKNQLLHLIEADDISGELLAESRCQLIPFLSPISIV
jgi:hypothetical protein